MTLSFRTRILLLVLAVAVLPLGLIGLWLTGSAGRSGETLLRARLMEVLETEARALETSWIRYRTALLDLSETPVVQRALYAPPSVLDATIPPPLATGFASLQPQVEAITVRDRAGRVLWRLGRDQIDAGGFLPFGALLSAEVPLYEVVSGEPLGRLEARVPINALMPTSARAAAVSAVITARDPKTGALLLPAPFEPALLERDRFQWNDEAWITMRRPVVEPRVELLAAAPIAPFAAPFRGAARRGVVVLLLAAVVGVGVAGWMTARLTRSLEQLAVAASDVASGQLGRTVNARSDDEVGRVGRAFNTMTEQLRRTLDQLAERESLAAVNEFAAGLAHEVRNPLTSIRLDLQEVEERLPADSALRELQSRALEDVARLDRTVAAALDTARTAHVDPKDIDLRDPIRAAVRAAAPAFDARRARLEWVEPSGGAPLRGDADALERVFLNLLLNAAESLGESGGASIALDEVDRAFVVTVRDEGRGIAAGATERAFDPFYTTRPGGTGVGLTIARRIVAAHRGEIGLHSEPGKGTTVTVRLPCGL